MSRALFRTARPLAVPAVALALGLALTGCGAGFEAQTYQTRLVGDGTNAAAGSIAIRNATVTPADDGALSAGDDAEVSFWLTNDGGDDDRLVEATSPLGDVELVDTESGGTVDEVELPRLGTTGLRYGAVIRSIAEDLRAGEYVELTLRFERNGELRMLVPLATSGEYDYERERSDNFHPPGDEGHGESGDTGGRGGDEGDRGDAGGDDHSG